VVMDDDSGEEGNWWGNSPLPPALCVNSKNFPNKGIGFSDGQ
jgi:hypothetical protein